jgi:apolipoprotein D and lipocalin family protein
MTASIPLAIFSAVMGGLSIIGAGASALAWRLRRQKEESLHDLEGLRCITNHFDIKKYSGTWFEQRRMGFLRKNNASQVTASYFPREDGFISVINSSVNTDGTTNISSGLARFTQANGVLLVAMKPPREEMYVILYLDDAYTMSIVGEPRRKLLWMLTRNRIVTHEQMNIFSSIALLNDYTHKQINTMSIRGWD